MKRFDERMRMNLGNYFNLKENASFEDGLGWNRTKSIELALDKFNALLCYALRMYKSANTSLTVSLNERNDESSMSDVIASFTTAAFVQSETSVVSV